jgi:ketosteroid isomerase-like protein
MLMQDRGVHATAGARRIAVLAAIFAIGACANTVPRTMQTLHSADVNAIRSARLAQNAAIIAGDVDGIAQYWTEDVDIRRGLGGFVQGKQAYRQLFADDSHNLFVRTPVSIDVSDAWPLAFESGEWAWHEGSPDAPVIVSGRYSAQWVKREGRWLIRGEVFTALRCEGVGCNKPAIP